jgi:hypothetical protein
MSRPQGSERVGSKSGTVLAALAALLVSAAPAAAGVEPPPAKADDDAPDAAQDAPDLSDAEAAREMPDPSAQPIAPPSSVASPAASEPSDAAAAGRPAAEPQAEPQAEIEAAAPADAPAAAPVAVPTASAAAAAAPAPQLGATALATTHVASDEPSTPRIGAGVDLGLPDGATVSIVVRPIRSLRAHAGLSHNLISLGERVGLTWVPLSWWASPTLSVEYGHYADGNANPLVRMVSGDASFSSAILDRVGYDYANAHVGLELGRRWFTFYIHAGYSRITSTVHNLSAETMSESAGNTTVTFSKDPSVRLWSVSARAGFIVYLAK